VVQRKGEEGIEGPCEAVYYTGRRIQMLHDLANDDGYIALKWVVENIEGWRQRESSATDDNDSLSRLWMWLPRQV